MLPDAAVAAFLASCLSAFFAVNLYNLAKSHKAERGPTREAEVKTPSGPIFAMAAFGTLLFFAESIIYAFLVLLGLQSYLTNSPLQLRFPSDTAVQAVGLFLTAAGYLLFAWSVIARGIYSTSWEMRENHKLVTWGPYRYVRHPSYAAYFILFAGLLLTLLNIVAVIPLLAIPGYIAITKSEDELLTKRFSEAYTQYQQATGRFFPRLKKHKAT
jgi:protein-S-isoprenylcysteine O-methyltransferase Ste14